MDYQKTNSNIHRQHDDWDEVHQQMQEVQAKQRIQKKSLAISDPADADEKEADEIARKVTGGESAQVHGTGGTIHRKTLNTDSVLIQRQHHDPPVITGNEKNGDISPDTNYVFDGAGKKWVTTEDHIAGKHKIAQYNPDPRSYADNKAVGFQWVQLPWYEYWVTGGKPLQNVFITAGQRTGVDPIELFTIAMGEGLAGWIQANLPGTESERDAKLTGTTKIAETDIDYTKPVHGFYYLGLDVFSKEADDVKKYLPADYNKGDEYSEMSTDRNEKFGQEKVESAVFKNLQSGIDALAAVYATRRDIVVAEGKKLGYGEPTADQREFWSYWYYKLPSEAKQALKLAKSWDYTIFLTTNFQINVTSNNKTVTLDTKITTTGNHPKESSSKALKRVATTEYIKIKTTQKKSLSISDPQDHDEREADEVARKVVDGQQVQIHGTGETINRKAEGSAEASPEFQSDLERNIGGGQSLDDSTRSEMESKMGTDLSDIKIHTDSAAHSMNESISAKAFTHGQDVFFRQGEYNTQTSKGKELLAHELTHTVQQRNGSDRKMQAKIQRQGHDPKKDYESGQMRQDFNLHNKDLATSMTHAGGTEPLYFPEAATVTLKSSSADSFWVEVEGEAFYKSGDVPTSEGLKIGWVRRNATTMTKGLYSGLNIVDRSQRGKVTVNEDAVLNSISGNKTITPLKKGGSQLYFKKDTIVIMGDALTWDDKKLGEQQWNKVEGIAYYKAGDVEKSVAGYSEGYVKFSQLNMTAPTPTSLGNIGTNAPMGKVQTITLHQTGSRTTENPDEPQSYDDPMAITGKIGRNNQFANYVITTTGEIGLITPVNEQMSQNPYGKMKANTFLITKPLPTSPATEFNTGDKEFETKMQGIRTIITDWYKDGSITKEVQDYWLNKKPNTVLFNALESAKWDLFITASYNQNSVSIEVVGDELKLGMPEEKTEASVNKFKEANINNNEKISPNFREQLKNMHWLTFYNYMDHTGDGTIYGDITPQQKYASWLLTNKIAQDAGIADLNARTLVAHTDVDYKARGEGVGNKEFILAMIEYKKTMAALAGLTAKMTEEEHKLYDADAAVMTLVDGPQLKMGDTGYESVNTFFTDFYGRKKAMDDLLTTLKARK